MNASPAFEWSREDIERVGARVASLIGGHVTALRNAPAFRPMSREERERLQRAPAPYVGIGIDAVLGEFTRAVLPHPFGNGHPRFFGWVNSPPAMAGVFAEALAAAMNPSVAGGNHAAVYVEHAVTAWLRELAGFPESAKGLLVSGTSAAAIIALNTARFAACERAGWDVRAFGMQENANGARPPRMLVYRSEEGHGCHQKAAELLGFGASNIRTVPVDGALRMDSRALDAMLAEDIRAGHLPVAVIASAGTVNTGAVDPLDAIADICGRHRTWLHVDGAYGAPASLSARYASLRTLLGRADSIALDPHKWMYVPVDAGCVIVKDARAMRAAASLVPPYLRTDGDEGGVQGPPWFSEYGIEQTRSFRALKIWFALKAIGLDGYRTHIEHDLAMADHLAALVQLDPALELLEPRGMSIVCFRAVYTDAAASPTATDAMNRAILRAVQVGGEAFLSGTVIHQRVWLRACVINPRTRPEDMDVLLGAVRAARQAHLRGSDAPSTSL